MNRDEELGRGRRGMEFGGRGEEDRWEREGRGDYGRGYGSESGRGFGGEYGRNERFDRDFGGREREQWGRGERGFGGPQWGNESYTGGVSGPQGTWRAGRFDENVGGREGMGMQRGYGQGGGGGYGQSGGYGMGGMGGGRFGGMEGRMQRRGRPPKGYTRSDERVREDVYDMLSDHDWLDASEIEVKVQDGVVTLTGTVEDRDAKRIAEDLCHDARGVKDVQNQLRIQSREDQRLGRDDGGARGTTATGRQEKTPRA